MLKAAAANGWIDGEAAALGSPRIDQASRRRFILTYLAAEVAETAQRLRSA